MAYIKSISYYLPQGTLTTEELAKHFKDDNVFQLSKSLGVSVRHVVDENETAGDLAVKAAEKLFEENNIDRSIIDFVVLSTQNSDYISPSTSCIIQDKLSLDTNIGAFSIDLGCSGYVYGLAVANSFVESGLAKNVLLLTADTATRVLPENDKNRLLFGDGASATIVSGEGIAEIGDFVMGTDGSGYDRLIIKNGGFRHKERTNNADDWMYMDGEAIFNFTIDKVPPLILNTAEKNKIEKDDIDYYVFHQANKFMLNTIRKVCKIPKDIFFIDMEDTGNTTSSTVPIGLVKAINNDKIKEGNTVMISGFGVGLSWAGCILKF